MAPSSEKLDTRSDLISKVSSKREPDKASSIPDRVIQPPAPKKVELDVDDISFASSTSLDYSIKHLDMQSILKYRKAQGKGYKTRVRDEI